ncbi:M48 family metalloprotease [Bosea sp. 685]|uniref:M48 family metalloprotease n=1 Tax=Bosea sp. 685 TaxID=3080057 RepID=UPI0028932134|nr:M48 family metalloprotease [Bosea sp. 685]WNJ93398.1 M48 family metalloprotease [Bosea sp. 685]
MLSAIVSPLVLLILGGLLHLAARLGLMAANACAGAAAIHGFASGHMAHFEQVLASLDKIHGLRDIDLLVGPMARLAPLAIPSLIAGGLVWLWLRGLFLRAGGKDLIARLKARPANLDDLDERQLSNIVEEVAIGAGAPAPRLFLIDSPLVNAAALGRSHKDGVILVTRGLLDRLDRSETEAVVARLISAIGAGDLRAAAGIAAVFQTFGFCLTLLDLPLRWSAWRTLGALALVAISPRPGAEALSRVGEGLEEGLQADTLPHFEDIDARLAKLSPLLSKVAQVAMVPWLLPLLVSLLFKLVLFLWTAFFLGPPMAMLWRNRCYWTDARTVKLARHPEAFARALEKIGAVDPPPGAEAHEYLFIGAPTAARRSAADRRSMTLALAPSPAQRVERLSAMGASVRHADAGFDWAGLKAGFSAHPVLALIGIFLALLLVPLFLALFVMIGYLTALVMTMGLAAGLGLVLWLV